MTAQLLQTLVNFDEFIEWLPESSACHYELHRGVVTEMPKPRGQHSKVAGYTALEVGIEIKRLKLPYFIPKECIVRSLAETGFEPDVIVLDKTAIANEPRWERESIITLGQSIKLIVEVVSSNWQDDYALKLVDYEALGVQEYWIADYAALGGRRYIGNPKQPTFTVCTLVDGEYELRAFRGSEQIISRAFPELNLSVDEVFAA